MTESIVSGKGRRNKRGFRQLINSVIQTPSLVTQQVSILSSGLTTRRVLNRRNFLWGLLASCGVAAPIFLIIMIVVGAAVTSGYNHVSDPISQLAATGSPHPGWLTTGFITYGIMSLCFGFVLYRSIRNHRFAWLVLLFYILHGIGFLLGGVFSDDSRVTESILTASGILHNVWIIIGCLSFVAAMFIFAWLKRKESGWWVIAKVFIIFLITILLTFAVSQIPTLVAAEGVFQRVYGFLSIVLIETAAIRLFIYFRRGQIDSGEKLYSQP